MGRLTEDSVTDETYIKQCASSCPYDGEYCGTDECPVLNAVADKLGEYERAEEQGLLVRLPNDLSKKVYRITYEYTECSKFGETVIDCENYNCSCDCDSEKKFYIVESNLRFMLFCNYYDELGKTVFLTREEAEKKLEKLRK